MARETLFVWNYPVYAQFIGPTGPIARDLERRARTLEWKARATAPMGDATTYAKAAALPYRRPPPPPGRLKASIHRTQVVAKGRGLEVQVGSKAKYSLYVHEGTGSHPIRSRGPWNLMFWWKKHGKVVLTRQVSHPPTKGQPFLTKYLREAVR